MITSQALELCVDIVGKGLVVCLCAFVCLSICVCLYVCVACVSVC